MSEKPTPLKVFGRSHYACTRCKLSKVKCLGEKPACANCKAVHKEDLCVYPARDRKIVIMESDLAKIQARVDYLESLVKSHTPYHATADPAPLQQPPASNILVPRRLWDQVALDSYLLPGSDDKYPTYPLLLLCAHHLPDEAYARSLIETVYNTYVAEFYFFDLHEFSDLASRIYQLFSTGDLLRLLALEPDALIPSSVLCHFFVVLAYGEQLRNSTVDPLPRSITDVTGAKQLPGLAFYNVALRLYKLANEVIDIRFIQCSILLGFYAANLNCHNTVQTFFGIALRSAITNGYHRKFLTDPAAPAATAHESLVRKEKSKRVWWSIFVVDNTWAAKMNMPVHIHYTDTDVALPNESPLDLHDGFNAEFLEANVHLVKFLAQFNKLIYGPNIRTLSINYINTEQFNQRLLVKNILSALKTIVNDFENTVLNRYKDESLMCSSNRVASNLILRYNQLVILIITPLITIAFDHSDTFDLDICNDARDAIDKGIQVAISTIRITTKYYEHKKLFVLGFWDSQHLFSAILILILTSFAIDCTTHLNCAVALLRYMADNGNINAKNFFLKLERVKDIIDDIPEARFKLDLTLDINDFALTPTLNTDRTGPIEHFNPLGENPLSRLSPRFPPGLVNLLFDCLGIKALLAKSQSTLSTMARTLVGWDSYKGMPIHVSGTGRVAPPASGAYSHTAPSEMKIEDLI